MRNRCFTFCSVAAGVAMLASAGCMTPGDDGVETATEEAADSVYQWTDDVQIAGMTSPYQVGLASHGDGLHMVFTGDNSMLYRSHFTGAGWSTVHAVPNQSAAYGPALADFDGKLTLVYHAKGQNRLLMSTSTDGATWSSPVTAGTSLWNYTLDYAPALAVHRGLLYAAYCENLGTTQRVQIDRFDGTTWTSAKTYALTIYPNTTNTCKHVALASLPDGRLDVTWTWEGDYRSPDGSSSSVDWYMVNAFAHGAGVTWDSAPSGMGGMKSKKPPSIVTCAGKTHLVHGGYSNPLEIWWTLLDPATGTWNPDVRVPDQASDGGAALGCYGGTRTLMVHDGGYTPLWWSEFGS
jgi:hypothetical protein